jgi:hypothetical protein
MSASNSANEHQLRAMLEANINGDLPAYITNNNNANILINHDDYANVFYKGWILTSNTHSSKTLYKKLKKK